MTVTDNLDDIEIQKRLVSLTRDLILIPSIPDRPDDRQRCIDFCKNHLEALDQVEVKEYEDNGIPSIVALPEGCSKPEILMCGHLDVISHPDIGLYKSFIENNRVYGPGAGDMKGSLAIMLEIFREMHTCSPGISLGIAITADEEVGGESGIGHLFNKQGLRCGLAMIPDGGAINEITVEEKGILHLRLECYGKSAHAARPWLGENALEKMVDNLSSLKQIFAEYRKKGEEEGHHWYPSCSVNILKTKNKAVNRIPSTATAILDVRFPPPLTVETMLEQITQVLTLEVEVHPLISAEPTHLSPDSTYQKITEEIIGQSTQLIKDDGGSDARFIAAHGIPVLMSRPTVGNLHAHDEWIDIDSMLQFYNIYKRYLHSKLLTA